MSLQGESLDPALTAQRPQPTQLPLEPQAVEWLMICLAADRQLFDDASRLIGSHHFLPNEEPLRILYLAICDVILHHGQVTPENLKFSYHEQMRGNPNLVLGPEQQRAIFGDGGMLDSVAEPSAEMNDGNISLGRQVLQRFVYERTIVAPLRRVVNQPAGIPSDIGEFLTQMNVQVDRASSINELPVLPVMPEIGTELLVPHEFRLTGVSFLDNLLGGDRVGDANGLLGPTGGGKTTLGIGMAVMSAKQEWNDAEASGRERGVVIFVTAEESARKVRPRIWSAALQIPRTKLECMSDWSQLTTQDNIAEYERVMQSGQELILSERDRYEMGREWLGGSMEIVDLSGSEDFPNCGSGGVDELVSVVARVSEQRKQPIRSVYIDYAGILCERFMQANGMNESNYRWALKRFADDSRQKIAERFKCTAWLLHQLRGDAGKVRPHKLMHHTDAGESKDFANNLAVCLCLGTPDPLTGCRRLNPSKVRFRANEALPPVTLRIDDQFATMNDVTARYSVDETGGRFLTADEVREVGGVGVVENRQSQAGPAGLAHPAAGSRYDT